MVGRGHCGGAVTLVDRKSSYLLLGKVPNRQATTARQAIRQLFELLPANLRKALTLDSGKEFAEHERLAAEVALRVCFAKFYCPPGRRPSSGAPEVRGLRGHPDQPEPHQGEGDRQCPDDQAAAESGRQDRAELRADDHPYR